MRSFMGGTFIVVGLLILLVGIIRLFNPKIHRLKMIGRTIVLFFIFMIIGGIILPPENTAEPEKTDNAAAEKTDALPFNIEEVYFSDLFKNNLKLARVGVGVTGGTPEEWAATSIAIAEKVASFGADSAKVSVRRNEIRQKHGIGYREVARAYYSPDPARSAFDDKNGQESWKIYVADKNRLGTQMDANIHDDYLDLKDSMLEKDGSDAGSEAIAEKAEAVILKKYNLPKDWHEPVQNIVFRDNSKEYQTDRKSITVDASAASGSLGALSECMNGKMIYQLRGCGN